MRKHKTKWLITITRIDEDKLVGDGLPEGAALSQLPDSLDTAIRKIAPTALNPEQVFLVTGAQHTRMLEQLETHSLPYHDYAVSRGEACTHGGCASHTDNCMVIDLNARRSRRTANR